MRGLHYAQHVSFRRIGGSGAATIRLHEAMMALQRRGRSRSRGRNECPFADAIFPWLQDRTLHSTRDGKNHRRWLQRAWARLLFGFYMSAVDSGHAVFVSPVTGYRAQVCNVRTRTSTTGPERDYGLSSQLPPKNSGYFQIPLLFLDTNHRIL